MTHLEDDSSIRLTFLNKPMNNPVVCWYLLDCYLSAYLLVMCQMNTEIQNKVFNDFSESDREAAIVDLMTITLQHVMAESQTNLDSTWLSILKLSDGNLDKLRSLVEAAKKDFRDVIYWATLEDEK